MLDQQDVGCKVTCGARGVDERPAPLLSPRVRLGEWPVLSFAGELPAERSLFVDPGRGGLGGRLLAVAAVLSFCSGLCGLVASPAFEVEAPRWFIVTYGAGCALLALLAPFVSGSRRLHTLGRLDHGSPTGEGKLAPVLNAP